MNEYKMVINKEGHITAGLVLLKDEVLQNYILKEDEILAPIVDKLQDINGYKNVVLIKPKWNGSGWIETATQEEFNEAYPLLPTSEPTKEELLEKQLLETQAIVANLQEQILLNGGIK